ncbi:MULTISPECIES: helix-turn-helix transcriptional regulator [Kribbella]|uniref:Helix-turn-helix protein n=1 Tax=Kribbella pratensis TaxID=2512112 RepID=A0ABY2FP77_9ACTN|nr:MULTISPECIES: helix-turn-helix transcriptional regulator [Kribbella]TDW94737.1 helix-turn-helix protein [Kribbella pratensis]TDX03332.1 helix-turn-helix protein [Kribbella sp. VKM Ac-2566]
MSTSPSDAARKAQQALGLRLRELRKDAGLSGRELAVATGWHFTRVSKIENGVQGPTDPDIRTWCAACSAEDQIPDLIAQARAVESMYMEFKRRTRAGMKQLLQTRGDLFERTERFRIYEHNVIPGLFQTAEYAAELLSFWIDFLDTRNDIEAAVAARIERQAILYRAAKTFSVVLEEAAIRTQFGTAATMAGQLDRLLSVMTLPNISFGVVPLMVQRRTVGSTGFWIFDDALVSLETPTASIDVSQPQEIGLYERMFEELRQPAVYGRDARRLILRVLDELG